MFKLFDNSKEKVSLIDFVDRFVNDYYVSADFDDVEDTVHVFIGNKKKEKDVRAFERCPFSTHANTCLVEMHGERHCDGRSGWETCENVKGWKEEHE